MLFTLRTQAEFRDNELEVKNTPMSVWLKESLQRMTEYSAKPKMWLVYTHDTDFLYGKSEKTNFVFHRDANKDSYGGRPKAGKEQSSLPTSPGENKTVSSMNYFKVTRMDLI